ncbi:hypothetical protein BGX38DRAFT_1259611 [Terfezia claveryi]|nr:hypothetical protein BGX38DRAFT_1259611 [Terfezia claveryi]
MTDYWLSAQVRNAYEQWPFVLIKRRLKEISRILVTPVDIHQSFQIHKTPGYLSWNRQAFEGPTYVMTDRGPQKRWRHRWTGLRTELRMRWLGGTECCTPSAVHMGTRGDQAVQAVHRVQAIQAGPGRSRPVQDALTSARAAQAVSEVRK